MITSDLLGSHGLLYVAYFITDIVSTDGFDEAKEHGMFFSNTWATPETCYWLHEFLRELEIYNPEVMEKLRNGTNHPELLK